MVLVIVVCLFNQCQIFNEVNGFTVSILAIGTSEHGILELDYRDLLLYEFLVSQHLLINGTAELCDLRREGYARFVNLGHPGEHLRN